jgi:hypothetical protein
VQYQLVILEDRDVILKMYINSWVNIDNDNDKICCYVLDFKQKIIKESIENLNFVLI